MNEMLIKLRINQIRECVQSGKFIWTKRDKNINAINRLGISIITVKEIVSNLTVAEYHRGPENDYDGSEGSIWKFLHPITNEVIYIKLKLFTASDEEYVKVLSFHGKAENE